MVGRIDSFLKLLVRRLFVDLTQAVRKEGRSSFSFNFDVRL